MDVEILSRIQFAFTASFHYLYPPFSIGLGVCLVIMEGLWLKTREPRYHNMARFWTKVFGLTFAMGVATGIVLEFEFGTNWATYSRFVGDIFGSILAAEGIFAFFLESGFLALLLFGWNKVGPYMHFFATCMVCLGSHFSAIWIVTANSWMQTPAGFKLNRRVLDENGLPMIDEATGRILEEPLPLNYVLHPDDLFNVRAVIDDYWAMMLNPSNLDRQVHVILGCWLAGAFLVISISAFYILRRRHLDFARTSLKIGLVFATITSLLQLVSADSTARGVAENQPVKLAAIEGLWETTDYAPLGLVGFVTFERDAEGNVIGGETTALKIPGLLSLLVSGDFLNPLEGAKVTVPGLNQLPPDEFLANRYPGLTPEELAAKRPEYWPNVPFVFQTYHIMIACGMALIAISLTACFLWWRGWLFDPERSRLIRWFLLILVFSVALPQIANQCGWYTAEVGRQPWIVYEIMKTSQGVSQAIRATEVLLSLILFFFIYALLFMVFIYLLTKKIIHGPTDEEDSNALPESWRKYAKGRARS